MPIDVEGSKCPELQASGFSSAMAQEQPEAESRTRVQASSAPSVPKSRRFRAFVSLLLQLVCIGYIGHVLYRQRLEIAHAFDLDAVALLALGVLMAVAHLQRTYEFTFMLRRLGVREAFWDGFWLTGAGFLLNHLPFNAGLVMRATVLKRDHALPYASYVALVAVNALVNVSVAALLGVAAVFLSSRSSASVALAVGFGLLLCASVGALFFPSSWIPKGTNFVARRLRVLAEGFALIRGNGSSLALLGLLATSKLVMAAVRMWICFGALGISVSPLAAAVLASTTILMSIVSITPGNLGLRELALAALSTLLGNAYAVGVAAASVDRVVLLAYTLVSGVPGLLALRRRGPFAVS